MTRGRVLADIVRGVEADRQAYGVLRGLLEEQFGAVVRHDAAALGTLAGRVTALVADIEGRREEREAGCASLAGAGSRLEAILPLLPAASRHAFVAAWRELEAQVRECKVLNARNGHLMTEQHQIMQRVLHGEVDTYAPT
jgi:flagella synthesis protein FlgN